RGGGRHHDQVRAPRQIQVTVERVRRGLEHGREDGGPRQSPDRQRADEPRGRLRHRGADLGALVDEETQRLARLEGGDPARESPGDLSPPKPSLDLVTFRHGGRIAGDRVRCGETSSISRRKRISMKRARTIAPLALAFALACGSPPEKRAPEVREIRVEPETLAVAVDSLFKLEPRALDPRGRE